jgi:ATP-dependent RNA helicase HelY
VLRVSQDADDRAVLLARGWGANPRMVLLGADGSVRRANAEQLGAAMAVLGQMILPEPVRTKDGGYRNSVARLLRDWEPDPDYGVVEFRDAGVDGGVGECPHFGAHMQNVRRLRRAEKEIRRLAGRIDRDEGGLVRQFRTLLSLLENWGYVSRWKLTAKGEQLRFVYNELDLLLTESVSRGLLDGLTGTQLAAVVSLFTYEARRQEGAAALPPDDVTQRVEAIEQLALELTNAERSARLAVTRLPEAGFAAVAYAWAAGHDLEDLFDDDLAAGDFVRNCRQLIDVMRQLRDEFPQLRAAARDGVERVDRGVVAAGGRA